jgi:hypothetical protein
MHQVIGRPLCTRALPTPTMTPTSRMPYPAVRCVCMATSTIAGILRRPNFLHCGRVRSNPVSMLLRRIFLSFSLPHPTPPGRSPHDERHDRACQTTAPSTRQAASDGIVEHLVEWALIPPLGSADSTVLVALTDHPATTDRCRRPHKPLIINGLIVSAGSHIQGCTSRFCPWSGPATSPFPPQPWDKPYRLR